MTLIVCVDDGLGMAFGGRRQSRDRALCEDMLAFAAGRTLRMSPRSAKLFEGMGGAVEASADYMQAAGGDECCFVELEPAGEIAGRADTLVIYRWNRRYPSDLRFDVSLEGWRQTGVREFAGTSHEKITREVYIREDA